MKAQVYERKPLSMIERLRTQVSANSLMGKIVNFFATVPNARISPSEFKQLMKLKNPIHSIRPRFTELEGLGFLQSIKEEKVPSESGGFEHRYMMAGEEGQLRLL
jgi:hypothetical protein